MKDAQTICTLAACCTISHAPGTYGQKCEQHLSALCIARQCCRNAHARFDPLSYQQRNPGLRQTQNTNAYAHTTFFKQKTRPNAMLSSSNDMICPSRRLWKSSITDGSGSQSLQKIFRSMNSTAATLGGVLRASHIRCAVGEDTGCQGRCSQKHCPNTLTNNSCKTKCYSRVRTTCLKPPLQG